MQDTCPDSAAQHSTVQCRALSGTGLACLSEDLCDREQASLLLVRIIVFVPQTASVTRLGGIEGELDGLGGRLRPEIVHAWR